MESLNRLIEEENKKKIDAKINNMQQVMEKYDRQKLAMQDRNYKRIQESKIMDDDIKFKIGLSHKTERSTSARSKTEEEFNQPIPPPLKTGKRVNVNAVFKNSYNILNPSANLDDEELNRASLGMGLKEYDLNREKYNQDKYNIERFKNNNTYNTNNNYQNINNINDQKIDINYNYIPNNSNPLSNSYSLKRTNSMNMSNDARSYNDIKNFAKQNNFRNVNNSYYINYSVCRFRIIWRESKIKKNGKYEDARGILS